MKAKLKLNAIIEPVEEGGYFAFIEELPNVCTQGETLEEVKENLKDALEMTLEAQRDLSRKKGYNQNVIREELMLP
jgi:predicted RNase H-like HicB family nuclease